MFNLYIRTDNWLIGRWLYTGESYVTISQAMSNARYLNMTTKRTIKINQR